MKSLLNVRNSTLLSVAIIYVLRVVSGLATLVAIVLIDIHYSSTELAHYSVFMFIFNLATVVAVWGGNITIIERSNKSAAVAKAKTDLYLGHCLLDGLLATVVFYSVLEGLGYWSNGLLAVVTLGVAGVISALLIVQKKAALAILCNEFSRAYVPMLVMLMIFSFSGEVAFERLIEIAYITLFCGLPCFLVYAQRNPTLNIIWRINISAWWDEKKQAIPIVLPQLLIVVVVQADRLVIEHWGSAIELASYFAAQAVYMVVVFGTQAVINFVTPEVSKVAARRVGSFRQEGRMVLIASGLLSALLLPAAYVYFSFLSIDRYTAMTVLLCLVGGGVVSSLFGIGLTALQFCNEKRNYLFVVVIGLASQYLTIALLYSAVGIYAIAFGFVVYSFVTAVVANLFWKKQGVCVSLFSLTAARK